MLGVLTDPNGFFENRVQDPSLPRALLVVLTVAIIGGISSYVTLQQMFSGLQTDAAIFGQIALLFAVAGGLFGPFITWGVYTVVFYGISLAFDPEGSFKTLATFTAWGYVPQILNVIIGLVLTYLLFQQIQPPTSPEAAAQFQGQLQQHALYQLSVLIGIVFSLWRAFIWTFAVKHARSLTLKQSAIVVGIPVTIGILFTIITNLL